MKMKNIRKIKQEDLPNLSEKKLKKIFDYFTNKKSFPSLIWSLYFKNTNFIKYDFEKKELVVKNGQIKIHVNDLGLTVNYFKGDKVIFSARKSFKSLFNFNDFIHLKAYKNKEIVQELKIFN